MENDRQCPQASRFQHGTLRTRTIRLPRSLSRRSQQSSGWLKEGIIISIVACKYRKSSSMYVIWSNTRDAYERAELRFPAALHECAPAAQVGTAERGSDLFCAAADHRPPRRQTARNDGLLAADQQPVSDGVDRSAG